LSLIIVVRWEFKHPQPFLRTREFLWQEGHTAHINEKEAMDEVYTILDLYRRVYEELLAVPVIKGQKSENEKFAGGLRTTTVEGFIPTTGRGIQGGTSHCLGQNFSKMFNISVEDPDETEKKLFVWQNSWGLSTRSIGVMVMVHGDDKGLVMPPMVSQIQVVIIPCGVTVKTSEHDRRTIYAKIEEIEKSLKHLDIRVKADIRDTYSPGWKFNQYELKVASSVKLTKLKGVPIRIEIGPKDIAKSEYVAVRRDTFQKATYSLSSLTTEVPALLKTIQSDMFTRAKKEFDQHVVKLTEWKDVVPALDAKNIILVPWCEDSDCEDTIKERSGKKDLGEGEVQDDKAPSMGAKSLCIPFEQPKGGVAGLKCIQCDMDAKIWGLFGRSY
jgi:prolyl-tRNA synthetase